MSEHEQTPIFEGLFFFSLVWSLGGVCDQAAKAKFDVVCRKLLNGDLDEDAAKLTGMTPDQIPALGRPYVFPIPAEGSVFDYKLLAVGTKPEWGRWEDDVDPNAALPRDIYACQLVIPNAEAVKHFFLMNLFVEKSQPFLLVGKSGTGKICMVVVFVTTILFLGKSVYVKDLLHRRLDPDKYASASLFFTSNTAPRTTQVRA